jgi:hypothetical protein
MTVATGAWAASDKASCRVSVVIPRLAGVVVTEMQQPTASPAIPAPSRAQRTTRRLTEFSQGAAAQANVPATLLLRGYSPFQLSAELGAVTNVPAGSRRSGSSLESIRLAVSATAPSPSPSAAPSSASDRSLAPAHGGAVSLADLANRSVNLDQDALQAVASVEMIGTAQVGPNFTAEVIVTIWQFQ